MRSGVSVRASFVLAACCLVAIPAYAQVTSPSELVTVFAKRNVGKAGVGIAIASYDRGAIDIAVAPPLSRTTVVEIGSVSKTFTALLLADMVGRHEVALDDPIEQFLPAGLNAPVRGGKHITLLDLATQSSGLPPLPTNLFTAKTDPANPYNSYTKENLYDFLSHYTLVRDIGTQYEYSNLGVGLLGEILANRAKMSYEALLRERITKPLGMTHTSVVLGSDQLAAFATGHDLEGNPVHAWDFPVFAGAGGIRSTLDDMLKFVACAAGSGPPELVAAMKLAQTPVPGKTGGPNSNIGLVWQIGTTYGTIWHNGETGGFHALIALSRDRTRGVVVLANSAQGIEDIGFHLLIPESPLAQQRIELSLPPDVLEKYLGNYEIQPGVTLAISRDGNKLYEQLTGQQPLRIYASAPNEFFLRVVDAQISFVPRADGTIASLILHQNGRNTPAIRK